MSSSPNLSRCYPPTQLERGLSSSQLQNESPRTMQNMIQGLNSASCTVNRLGEVVQREGLEQPQDEIILTSKISASDPLINSEISQESISRMKAELQRRANKLGINEVGVPKVPDNEEARLDKLRDYPIHEADQEPFDNIVKMVSAACETPIALISIVDLEIQWFKARVGLSAPQTGREVSFCAHAINQPDDIFVVEDATKDERFVNNPLVTGHPNIKFYAGVPLVSPEGFAFGTLCAIDDKPRKLSNDRLETLKLLGKQVMTELNLRYYVNILKDSVAISDDLLRNILPESILPRLKQFETIADDIECASVFFADLKGFTSYANSVSAKELIFQIGVLFQEFDHLSIQHQVCKIKTIGDSYMAAAGVPEPCEPHEHTRRIVNFAFSVLEALQKHNEKFNTTFEMRIGIASGPCFGGVVGSIRFQYDIWGSTVNLASRIESTGIPGEVCISEKTYSFLKDNEDYTFEDRGEIEMKGLNKQQVYITRFAK